MLVDLRARTSPYTDREAHWHKDPHNTSRDPEPRDDCVSSGPRIEQPTGNRASPSDGRKEKKEVKKRKEEKRGRQHIISER